MTSKHPLTDSQQKLNRAAEIAGQLENEVEQLTGAYTDALNSRPGEAPGEVIIEMKRRPLLPDLWPTLLGEFASNARSALDYIVAKLWEANGKNPRGGVAQFPITGSEPSFEEAAPKIAPLTDKQKNTVRRHQPWMASSARPADDPLSLLQALNNVDKHVFESEVHPQPGILIQVSGDLSSGQTVIVDELVRGDESTDLAPRARLRTTPDADVLLQYRVGLRVVFGPSIKELRGRLMMKDVVRPILSRSEGVVDDFRQHFR